MKENRSSLPRGSYVVAALITTLILGLLAVVTGAVFVLSGAYDIAADVPHTKPVFQMVELLRDRSIAAHARGLAPPADLASSQRIASGAVLYTTLCAGCHLGPGVKRTDVSRGLYPKPPPLAYGDTLSTSERFWIIKHGLKLTGMPAWGKTHGDDEIWSLVAFLQKMPNMSRDEFQAAGASAPAGEAGASRQP